MALCEAVRRRKQSHSDDQPLLEAHRPRSMRLTVSCFEGLEALKSSSMKADVFDIRLR